MRRWGLVGVALLVAALGLGACGGGDEDDGGAAAINAFFELDRADAEAHEALPTVDDLPGQGWEIESQDEFGDDDDDDGFDFEAFAEQEPACGELTALANLGGVFGGGGDDGDDAVAMAQVGLTRASDDNLPTNVETEIEVKATAAEVSGTWELARAVFESDATRDCITEVMTSGFADQDEFAEIDFEFEAVGARAEAPQDGASLAFRLRFALAGVEVDGRFEMYFWPLGNAQVSVMFFGPAGDLERGFLERALERIDERIVAVARR